LVSRGRFDFEAGGNGWEGREGLGGREGSGKGEVG